MSGTTMNGEFDQRFKNCQSHRSFFRMRWHQPSASALSVPGRSGSQYLAVRPRFVWRGSTEMKASAQRATSTTVRAASS